jgi:hypothetical protein
MTAAIKKLIESTLADRFGRVFDRYERLPADVLPTGIEEIDNVLQGFPRGAITEIHGAASSGRTSLMLAAVATAMSQEEVCAVVDCDDTFDLSSAAKAGVDFDRLLWVRCGHQLERAFKAVDLILHAGGFGFVALNLGDVPAQSVRRVISTWWFRFRRAIENKSTVLIIVTSVAAVRSRASLCLQTRNEGAVWPSTLSIVSDNRYSSFTDAKETSNRLTLVSSMPKAPRHPKIPHSHFLESTCLRIDCERPVQWQLPKVRFSPQLR